MKTTRILLTVLLTLNLLAAASADLPLPYESSVSEAGEAFRVNNTYSGPGKSYGGWFEAAGAEGRGLYGRSTSTVPDANSYGGFFYAAGPKGRGVFGQSAGAQEGIGVKGWASNSGDVQNLGGHFVAAGLLGIGVYGWAESRDDTTNYGGYFQADGQRGVGVYAIGGPQGAAGVFEGNVRIDGASNGIIFPDGSKQTTAASPGAGGSSSAGGLPRPNYDSGWVNIVPGGSKALPHNLGGNVDNYFVDMQAKRTSPDAFGINNMNIGYYQDERASGIVSTHGARYQFLTTTGLSVSRMPGDTVCEYVRIRIWVYNQEWAGFQRSQGNRKVRQSTPSLKWPRLDLTL